MGDRVNRMLGAGEILTIDGIDYMLRPVVIQHLGDLERESLKHYKRQYLETFSENADLISNGEELVREQLMHVAKWTIQDLPQREAFDASSIPVTNKLKNWVGEEYSETPETDEGIRALVGHALDNEKLTIDKVKELSGAFPRRGRIRFDQWWVTGSKEGMISFIYSSVRRDHPEVKKEDVAVWPIQKIIEAARIVESLTSAAMGNT